MRYLLALLVVVCGCRDVFYPDVIVLEDDGAVPPGDVLGDARTGDTSMADGNAGDISSGDVLAGDVLAGDVLAGDVLAGDVLLGDTPVGDALAPGDVPQSGTVLHQETFGNGAPGFVTFGGTWFGVSDYGQAGACVDPAIAYLAGESWTEMEASATVRINNSCTPGPRTAGVLARVATVGVDCATDQYYACEIDLDDDLLTVSRYEGCAASASQSVAVSAGIDAGATYTVELRASGTTITCTVDAAPKVFPFEVQLVDPAPIASGSVGFRTADTRTSFDNLLVVYP